MSLRNITCRDCGVVLGTAELDRDPDGYLCEECGHILLGFTRRWIEFDKPISDSRVQSPIPDFLVYMTEPFRDVHEWSDDEITVSLCETDGSPSSVLLMGQNFRSLIDGEIIFSGLYVGKVGRYMLRLSSPGHEDVLSTEFEVS